MPLSIVTWPPFSVPDFKLLSQRRERAISNFIACAVREMGAFWPSRLSRRPSSSKHANSHVGCADAIALRRAPKRGCSTAGRSYHLFGAYRLRTQGNGTLVGFGKPLGCTFFHSLGHFRVRNKAQGSHPQRSGETAARVRGAPAQKGSP